MESLKIPSRFGGVEKKRPHVASCKVCGDFGTVLLGDAIRESKTMAEIMRQEAPCTCLAGDLWREAFDCEATQWVDITAPAGKRTK